MEFTADLTHVAFVLSLAFLGGLFLQRLRQPALVGYIIVGAVIGPGLLGLQGDDHTVRWLAELAIVLLMFMLGIELDVSKFRSAMKTALLAAGLQVFFGVGSIVAVSIFLGWTLPTAILFGFVIALSSTAVAMSMLKELGEENHETGRLATAILIAQDILVVPMLLIVNALSGGGVSFDDIFGLGLALGVIGFSVYGIFELARRPQLVQLLESFLTKGASQPVVAAMAICFAAAAISGSLGLSTAYGAFAIGLLLGNVGSIGASYRDAIHSIHELLMMVFFLSIGLMLDVGFITDNALKILLLLGITVFLKTVMNVFILRILNTPPKQAYPLGAILGQVGEFSFVLIALGLSNGFLNHETYQMALAVIALSLIISPLWLSLTRNYLHHSLFSLKDYFLKT